MSSDPEFLSFKGLKQYTPEQGWGQVNAILQAHTQPEPTQHAAMPDNVPTLTRPMPQHIPRPSSIR